jgi:galactokinase
LVGESDADRFRQQIHTRYRDITGIDADIYLCRASDGAKRLS